MQRRYLSRRDLLLSGGALALSGIAGGVAWNRACDAVVVGAGAAGIAAARTLRAAGASAIVLEAAHRIGGRIGGGVLSGVSRRQCDLHALVARCGAATVPVSTFRTQSAGRDGTAFTATYAAMFAALVARGERLDDGSGRDETVYDAVRSFRDRDGFREALAQLGIGDERGNASLLDYHLVANRAASPFVFPADDTLLVPAGLENVLAGLAGGVNIVFGARVASISYSRAGAVLRTEAGETYRARRAIVTVPTADLASGSIVLRSALPAKTAAAIAALPMASFGGVASSYATAGNAAARTELARPIDGALWFAGEATAPRGFGCVEGAWEAGAAAARDALAA